MQHKRRRSEMWMILMACLLLTTGCASYLKVYGVTNPQEFRGIRVHEAVSYVVTKKIKTEKCPERTEDNIIHLAVGPAYDINVEPSSFAKTEFSVQFSDTGVLKQVTMNSTPQVAETINAVANLAEKVGKIAGGAAAPAAAADCGGIISETIESTRRLNVP